MKKTLLALTAAVMILGGCSKPTPTPGPTPSVSESAVITEAPTTPPTSKPPVTKPTEGSGGNNTPSSPAPTSSEAGTPAVQFASRWGKKYPAVQEYQILRAANTSCTAIAETGENWQQNSDTMKTITDAVENAGIASADALEFAQDAQQNYCSSVS